MSVAGASNQLQQMRCRNRAFYRQFLPVLLTTRLQFVLDSPETHFNAGTVIVSQLIVVK